jgi:putative membrane protein insertion efficiency factor
LIRAYRRLLSPLLGSHCRFYPSCSAYAEEAFRVQPFLAAAAATFLRLSKCQPFHPGGFDPVE